MNMCLKKGRYVDDINLLKNLKLIQIKENYVKKLYNPMMGDIFKIGNLAFEKNCKDTLDIQKNVITGKETFFRIENVKGDTYRIIILKAYNNLTKFKKHYNYIGKRDGKTYLVKIEKNRIIEDEIPGNNIERLYSNYYKITGKEPYVYIAEISDKEGIKILYTFEGSDISIKDKQNKDECLKIENFEILKRMRAKDCLIKES